jgi:hypothetical protein
VRVDLAELHAVEGVRHFLRHIELHIEMRYTFGPYEFLKDIAKKLLIELFFF